MDCFDFIERDGAAPIAPVSGRGLLVIKGILRLTGDGTYEGKRCLVVAARRIAKVDLRRERVVSNHATEEISRDAAHKTRRCAKTRHTDSDIETRAPYHGHDGIAPIHGFDGQEINQGI